MLYSMIDILLSGAQGRIGTRIIDELPQNPDIRLVGALGNPAHVTSGDTVAHNITLQSTMEAYGTVSAILIEFSTPQAVMDHLLVAEDTGRPLLIGTTGFTEEQERRIETASERIPILISHNYGIGMNAFWEILKVATEYLKDDFDVEVVEFHAGSKVDVPSGTGNTIASIIARERGDSPDEVIRYGRNKEHAFHRKPREIGVHSLRGGSYRSDHTVIFAGNGERLEFTHREEDSSIIARGVLWGVRFLATKEAGLYGMHDVLDFKRRSSRSDRS